MRKAISLVALVITIIVLVLLTGATLLTLGDNGLFSRAQEATFKSDVTTLSEALAIKVQKEKVDAEVAGNTRTAKINVSIGQADYQEKMREILPKISNTMLGKMYVENDKLKINDDVSSPTKASETEVRWFNEVMAGQAAAQPAEPATPEAYGISTTVTNTTAAVDNANTIAQGGTVTLTFTASANYALPDTVTVTGATHTWNKATGTLTLSNPTDNITVTIASVTTGYTVTIASDFGPSTTGVSFKFDYYNGTSATYTATQLVSSYKGHHFTNVLSITATFNDSSMYVSTYPTLTPDLYNVGNEYEVLADLTSDVTILNVDWQSCILAETLVTMADGTQKPIGDIKVGEYILSYDWDTMELVPNKVIYASSQDDTIDWTTNRYYKRTFSDGTVIKNAYAHRFYNKEQKCFVYLEKWNIGEHTYKMDGTFPELLSCEMIQEPCTFARITGELGTNYFANGFLTGDRYCPQNISFEEVAEN